MNIVVQQRSIFLLKVWVEDTITLTLTVGNVRSRSATFKVVSVVTSAGLIEVSAMLDKFGTSHSLLVFVHTEMVARP